MPQVAELAHKPVQKRSRRITEHEANEIAQLIAEYRLTDTEACNQIGISPAVWFKWKVRQQGKGRFDHVLARVRANTIVSCFENIKRGEAKDWRASLCRLQLLDRNRFSVQPQQESQVAVTIDLAPTLKALGRVYGEPAKQLSCGVQATTGSVPDQKTIELKPQDTKVLPDS